MPSRQTQVVLVHGAFSDGSYWDRVIRLLHATGVTATAAQVNVQGFAQDVAALRRHLNARGDVDFVLVGHSYGGAVISQVAAGDARVKALVFAAAAGLVAGEPFGAWMEQHPGSYQTNPQLDEGALLWLPVEDCVQGLAHDLPDEDGRMIWAVQKPVAAASFGDSVSAEGWRDKPCWYLVTEHDRLIPPDGQRELARQLRAVTRSVASGHMVALSQPQAVADIIVEALCAVATVTGGPVSGVESTLSPDPELSEGDPALPSLSRR